MKSEDNQERSDLSARPEPEHSEAERFAEEPTQAVVRIDETSSGNFWESSVYARSKYQWVNVLTRIASIWVVLLAILSVLFIILGYLFFDVAPWHTLDRIAHEQQQNERQANLTNVGDDLSDHHVELGNSLLNLGGFAEANDEFERAIELDPTNAKAQKGSLIAKLFISTKVGNFAQADPAYVQLEVDRLKENFEDNTHIETLEGDLLTRRDPYNDNSEPVLEEAVQHYKTAVDIDPENARAYLRMGVVYFQLAAEEDLMEHEKASLMDHHLVAMRKASEAADWSPLFRTNYADALARTESYQQAIDQYKAAIYLDRNYPSTYNGMARVYRLVGDLPTANEAQREYVEMLESKEVTSLDRNKRRLVDVSTSGTTRLTWTPPDIKFHKYYAYYNTSITAYLMGKDVEAKEYVEKAKNLGISDSNESGAEKLISNELDVLGDEREEFAPRIDEFRREFNVPTD